VPRIVLGLLVMVLLLGFVGINSVPGRLAPTIVDPVDGSTMVLIPGGNFWMGSAQNDELAREDEQPQHQVYVDDFYIDMYEITNAQYKRFVDATGHRVPCLSEAWAARYNWKNGTYQTGQDNCPVILVCRCDAVAYAQWAKKRLPTEAQWEKAARGPKGNIWPWGNQWDQTRANAKPRGRNNVVPVGSYRAGISPYGVHDMAGNVFEWVYDWYDPSYYANSPTTDPMGPPGPKVDMDYVTRGGSWYTGSDDARGAARRRTPDCRTNDIGFRCARKP